MKKSLAWCLGVLIRWISGDFRMGVVYKLVVWRDNLLRSDMELRGKNSRYQRPMRRG